MAVFGCSVLCWSPSGDVAAKDAAKKDDDAKDDVLAKKGFAIREDAERKNDPTAKITLKLVDVLAGKTLWSKEYAATARAARIARE